MSAAAAQGSDPVPVSFNIDEQPLARALTQYSQQSRQVIVASADLLEGRTGNRVHGEMAPDAALRALLHGTGYEARLDGSGAYVLAAANTVATGAATDVRAETAIAVQQPAPPQDAATPAANPIERFIVTGVRGATAFGDRQPDPDRCLHRRRP